MRWKPFFLLFIIISSLQFIKLNKVNKEKTGNGINFFFRRKIHV